jgi:methyl-accepting chemotaxis protein
MAKDIDSKLNDIQEQVSSISESVHNIDKEVALTQQTLKNHTAHDEILDQQIVKQLGLINEVLQKNTASLDEHIRRTDLLETMVQKMDNRLSPLEVQHIQQEAIITWRHDTLMKAIKIVGAIGSIIAILVALKMLH